jgi:BirA family transcriptional regulator, biotin operon repressor / biotin---[acetyl-CoA-carboxylase] ligase
LLKKVILSLLKENENDFVSGQDISDKLGVTRTAVWKYINQIKDEGYKIESLSKKGYRLISSPDILTLEEIEPYLNTNLIGRNIIHFDSIESTNSKAKQLADKGEAHGTVVISEEQTKGRGRLGRSWTSPKYKGVFMSIILRPGLSPVDAAKLTQTAAAAVVKATNALGISTCVKWPNDIVLNHKKVCGILTEMNAELTRINYVVVGLGINVNTEEFEFGEDIKDIATSLKIQTKTSVNRKELVAGILNNFEHLYTRFIDDNDIEASINICRENSAIIGKKIMIINREKNTEATAINIDDEGRLLVEYTDGKQESLISGEISIRGKGSYI